MTKGLLALFAKDFHIALRNALFWVLLVSLAMMIVAIKFFVPEDFQDSASQYFYDQSNQKAFEKMLLQGSQTENLKYSLSELEQAVSENAQSIGVMVEGTTESPRFTVLYPAKVTEEQERMVEASLEKMTAVILGVEQNGDFQVRTIRSQIEPISSRLTSLPSLLTFEVLILGFMFFAVFMFQEKEEGSLYAYRISPGSTAQYIGAKVMVFLLIGLLYGFSLILLIMGWKVNYLMLGLVISLGSVLYTLLGGIVAVFFRNISEWLMVGIGILMINLLPVISYLYPSFSPGFVQLIPSYQLQFIFKELLFSTGKNLVPGLITLVVMTAAAYAACYLLIDQKLMKESRI